MYTKSFTSGGYNSSYLDAMKSAVTPTSCKFCLDVVVTAYYVCGENYIVLIHSNIII